MAKLPVAISPNDESGNSLTVTFTRQDFSEFVFNLFVTPREERRNYFLGFDLFKENFKKLLEKLEYHIETHHEILNQSATIVVALEDGTDLTYSSYAQLFDVDDPRAGTISSVNVSVTHVIAFFREGKKSFERQQTTLNFVAVRVGTVEIAIRSTDVTWPNGIFTLLERELDELSLKTAGSNSKVLRAPPSILLGNEPEEKIIERLVPTFLRFFGFVVKTKGYVTFVLTLLIILSLISVVVAVSKIEKNVTGAFIFLENEMSLVSVSPLDLISEIGLGPAVSQLRDGETLRDAGIPILRVPYYQVVRDYGSRIPHIVFVIGFVAAIFMSIVALNIRARSFAMVGRIFVFAAKSQPRETPNVLSAVVPSLAVGAAASLVATLIWEVLK